MTTRILSQYHTYFKISFLILFINISSLQNYSQANENLILAVRPYLPHDESIKKFTPLEKYLGHKINEVDISFMWPSSYVKMLTEYNRKPILTRLEINENPELHRNIISNKNSGIKKLSNLKGKRIAYGYPEPTINFIIPHFIPKRATILDAPFTRYTFLYNHTSVELRNLANYFYADISKSNILKKNQKQELISIAKIPDISEHIFIAQSTLKKDTIISIRPAMLSIKSFYNDLKKIKKSETWIVSENKNNYKKSQLILKSSDNRR